MFFSQLLHLLDQVLWFAVIDILWISHKMHSLSGLATCTRSLVHVAIFLNTWMFVFMFSNTTICIPSLANTYRSMLHGMSEYCFCWEWKEILCFFHYCFHRHWGKQLPLWFLSHAFLWSLKVDAIQPDSLPLIMTKPILELHSRGRKGNGKEELAQLLCVIGLEVGLRLQ